MRQIHKNKKEFLDLLLLADEQENMIDRYLERGDLYVLYAPGGHAVGVCVVTLEPEGKVEIKNIAVNPPDQGKGYGRKMIDFVCRAYQAEGHTLYVGTGETPEMRRFYQACGFTDSHRVRNFFTDHYEKPIYENGIQLIDMIYFQRALGQPARGGPA